MAEEDTLFEDAKMSTDIVQRADVPALPDMDRLEANIRIQKRRRQILTEYVRSEMSPERHFYNPKDLGFGGDKLVLNQEGARNLQGLYESVSHPEIEETLEEDGHLKVSVKTELRSMSSGLVIAIGTGLCTTRESKYAYRWVGEPYVPKSLDKDTLRMSTRGNYGRSYRIPNDDLADSYHTVRQIAVKRAEVNATCKLPGVTELFAPEDKSEDEDPAPSSLDGLRDWLKSVQPGLREAVVAKLFGCKPIELSKMPENRRMAYLETIRTYTDNGVDWKSAKVIEAIGKRIEKDGEKSGDDLFGANSDEQKKTEIESKVFELLELATQNGIDMPEMKAWWCGLQKVSDWFDAAIPEQIDGLIDELKSKPEAVQAAVKAWIGD